MLGDLIPRFEGRASLWLAKRAAGRAEFLMLELVQAAVALWEAESFSRYNNHEVACTVRFFACCRKVLNNDRVKYSQFSIHYDATQPTQAILDGLADPRTTPRPDLTLVVGEDSIRLEAKLLGNRKRWANLYATEGMARFLDGRYSARRVPGVMIGYLLSGEPDVVADWINAAIKTGLDLDVSQFLVLKHSQEKRVMHYESQHDQGIRLIHQMVDLR